MIKKLVGLGLASVAAMLFASTASAQGVTKDEILIGGFGPITGPAAYIGLGGRDGLAMAIKEINAAGGVNGRKFRLIFEDDGHSPTRALGAVKKLIDQDKVFMIFCAAGSNATSRRSNASCMFPLHRPLLSPSLSIAICSEGQQPKSLVMVSFIQSSSLTD